MKSHKEILDKLGIKDKTKHHNWDYVYESFLSAMESAAKQAFEARKDCTYADKHGMTSGSCRYEKFNTFEDYLKELEND
jgi:hypothetical protein